MAVRLALVVVFFLVGCRTELKLEQGRRYLCSRDAGENTTQCTPGFRCGLDGYCFDADAGEARACESSLDCGPAWRCGLATAGVGTCQRLGVPLPLPCADDSWCEGDWRCGPASLCVDSRGDALEPPAAGEGLVSRLSPQLPEPLVGVAVAELVAGGWQSVTASSSELTAISALPRELRVDRLVLDGGALAITSSPRFVAVVEAPSRTRLFQLTSAGELEQSGLIAFPPFAPRGLLATPSIEMRLARLLLAWDETNFAAWNLETNRVEVLGAPPGRIAAMHASTIDPRRLVAATSEGAFELERGRAVTWQPLVTKTPDSCGGPSADVRILRTRDEGDSLATLFVDPDSGVGCVALFSFEDGGARAALGPACEDRARARSLRPIDDGGTGVWVRCEGPTAGEFSEQSFCAGPLCAGPRLFLPPPREQARARVDSRDVAVDELGFQVMTNGEEVERLQFGSLVVPGVAEFDSVVALSNGARGPVLVGRASFGDGGLSKYELFPHFGFARPSSALDDPDLLPLAHVTQTADWRVLANGELWSATQGKPLARFSPVRPLAGDVVATARTTPDGGGFVYVSSFDSLFAGPIGPLGPTLPLRLVPASRSQITSLAAAPGPAAQPDGGVIQHVGYLVNQGRLFRFEARNQVWRSEEIELAEPAVSVWYDGARARVGLESGRIVGLPTRVPLTHPLPGGATASTFVSICRHTFVVGQPGVFALEVPDGGLATWRLDAQLNAAIPLRRRLEPPQPGIGLHLVGLDVELVAVNADGVVASRRIECGAGSP